MHQNVITDVARSGGPTRSLAAADVREFVFFGRLETRKGVMLLADAFDAIYARVDAAGDALRARLRTVTLTFLGKDPQLLSETLARRCAVWRDAPRCQFELNLDRDAALDYLQQVRCRALASDGLSGAARSAAASPSFRR